MPAEVVAQIDSLKAQLGFEVSWLLLLAWLLPLAGFVVEIFGGYWADVRSKTPAYLAVGCIAGGFVLSTTALVRWNDASAAVAKLQAEHAPKHHDEGHHGADGEEGESGEEGHAGDHEPAGGEHAEPEHHAHADGEHGVEHQHHGHHEDDAVAIPFLAGTYYVLAQFGGIVFAIDWYVDSLTLTMFCMVTLIATCIHVFAIGYMSDELTEDHVDHEVHLADGKHLHRPGRFYRFFAYLSLFSFSMLGLVLAGNVFQVFVFWELVGICSFLLIGFYTERKSASTAANKAFIMNRVGDFGFLIGLMVLVTYFGTFRFAESEIDGRTVPGLFEQVRGETGEIDVVLTGVDADGHTVAALPGTEDAAALEAAGVTLVEQVVLQGREETAEGAPSVPYWLLIVAGLGIFAGCVGKSAQFPLQTWLPDAMEGPTPVSALVHSATMVAAGVYLAGRAYPVFTPEVLLVIAYVGCITAFVAATIAIVATDIKRVLAYSTISQLGYMMLAIGVGGWGAGLFHLITHAFFKSLMFLCSGSVIHGCHHEQEMPKMGGLWRKMPITAFTMLVGVIAISGLAIPGIAIFGEKIAFSGFHSKDAIVATGLAYSQLNSVHFLLFLVPLVTAGITAFYMFRLWFFTFAGTPRDQHLYDHAHESPAVMTAPLLVLSVFAAFCAVGGEHGPLFHMLKASQPQTAAAGLMDPDAEIRLPAPHYVHGHMDATGNHLPVEQHAAAEATSPHAKAGSYALLAAFAGFLLAYLLYGLRVVNPADIGASLSGVHTFLVEKWRFDELYDAVFVRPVHVVSAWIVAVDRYAFDGFLHNVAAGTVNVAHWDRKFDESMIDGLVNWIGTACYGFGRSLRTIQTGRMRQYVVFIAVGVLTLFILLRSFFPGA